MLEDDSRMFSQLTSLSTAVLSNFRHLQPGKLQGVLKVFLFFLLGAELT